MMALMRDEAEEGQRGDWPGGAGRRAWGWGRCSCVGPAAEGGKARRLETGAAEVAGAAAEGPRSGCCSHRWTETAPCEPCLGMTVRWLLDREEPKHQNWSRFVNSLVTFILCTIQQKARVPHVR